MLCIISLFFMSSIAFLTEGYMPGHKHDILKHKFRQMLSDCERPVTISSTNKKLLGLMRPRKLLIFPGHYVKLMNIMVIDETFSKKQVLCIKLSCPMSILSH